MPTSIERMTARDSLHRQPSPSQHPISLDHPVAIHGTRWIETARRRKQPPKTELIQTDKAHSQTLHPPSGSVLAPEAGPGVLQSPSSLSRVENHRRAHFRSWMMAALASALVAPDNGERAIRTQSQPIGIWGRSGRTASRSTRFARFRLTAVPMRLPVTKPNRLMSRSFGAVARTTSRCAQVSPLARTRAKSDDRLSRCIRSTEGQAQGITRGQDGTSC